ncbi:MAG: MBL fold metallo-hydrolase [Planctomycetes bacterium]|nr:MBL fold metallo-hydrolase [Planctomycetota bacterium]
MLPKAPPRSGQLGFVYVPPYRIQGISVAGEQTVVQIPELDISFDIGLCPRIALSSNYIALSHGHMDHVAGLPYYFSQRMFQRIGPGTCVCHPDLAEPLRAMMLSWTGLEGQRTQFEIIPMPPDEQIEIKNNIFLRGIEVSHAVGAMGYAIVERRSKLKTEYFDLPQERLRALKSSGVEITRSLEIPLVAYTGDTELGPYLFRDEFANAKIVICECTFFEPDHKTRARVGKHLHVTDLIKLLGVWQADAIILVHLSRRTNLAAARELLVSVLGEEQAQRVHFLMDHRENRQRYEQQELELTA